MQIRKLTEMDFPEAQELYYMEDMLHATARPDRIASRAKEDSLPEDAFLSMLQDQGTLQLGAFDKRGNLMGIVRATLWEETESNLDPYVCLDNICVFHEFHRQGIATRLYEETKAWAQGLGVPHMELHVWAFNEGALAAYRKWGFLPQRYVLEQKI